MKKFNCNNIFENMPLALAYNKVIYDDNNEIKNFIILKTNKSLEEVTGFKKEDVINKKGSSILKDIINNPIEFIQICGEVALNGKSKSLEVYSKITGNYYEVRIFSDKEGYFATVFSDITDRKQKEEKIKQLSFHDQLTGLYNRRYFEDTIERLNDSRILPIGVITADIDNFKSINDIYGHRVGDEYIKKTAKILSNNVRNEDIVCRIGGDEFAVIIPGIKSEVISNIVNRIQSEIKKVDIKDFDFSISTGLEVKTDHKQDLEEIINKSDQKMYSMKELTKETALKKKLSIFKNKEKIVFEEFPMGIIVSDFKGNIVEVNNQFCNMLGYSKEELKNMTHFDITKKEDNKINKKYIKKLKNKEIESFELDKNYIKKNGEYLDVKLKVEVIKDNYGKPVYDFAFVKEK